MSIVPNVVLLAFGVVLMLGCAGAPKVSAHAPSQYFFPEWNADTTFSIKRIDAPEEEICSGPSRLDMCVHGLKSAFSSGINSVLSGYMKPADGQADFQVVFRMLKLSHGSTEVDPEGRAQGIWLNLDWQFELYDARGARRLRVEASTRSPTVVTTHDELSKHVEDLLGVVLLKIRTSLDQGERLGKPFTAGATGS